MNEIKEHRHTDAPYSKQGNCLEITDDDYARGLDVGGARGGKGLSDNNGIGE